MTLLADVGLLHLIVACHNQKGLRSVWAVCSHGQQEQDDFGSWNHSQPQITL